MKIGYSMLLGEYVDAKELAYGDTAGFQVCCPECRDALFKVERLGQTDIIEYLSHYRQPKEISDVCELRVKSIGLQERESQNAESRGQTIKAFRSVLREAVLLDRHPFQTKEDLLANQFKLQKIQTLRHYVEFMEGVFFTDSYLVEQFDSMKEEFESKLFEGVKFGTSFAQSIQRRIALDISRHLVTEHARKARQFLIVHALHNVAVILKLARSSDEAAGLSADEPTIEGEGAMDAIFSNDLKKYMDFGSNGKSNGYFRFNDYVMENLVGTLIRLPYLEMLANHRAGRPMLEGIDAPEDGIIGFARETLLQMPHPDM